MVRMYNAKAFMHIKGRRKSCDNFLQLVSWIGFLGPSLAAVFNALRTEPHLSEENLDRRRKNTVVGENDQFFHEGEGDREK